MNKKIIIGIIVGALIIGGCAFYGGMAYAKSSMPRGSFGQGNFNGQVPDGAQFMRSGANAGQRMGGATFGEIIAKDDTTITLKLADGGSKIVFLTEKTPVTKNTSGSFSDLSVGEQVVVTGSANQDGSLTAEAVQLGGTSELMAKNSC